MTPEMIELYKAVQGRRGEWQYGDRALWQGRTVFVNAVFEDGDVEISAGYDDSGTFCEIADVNVNDPDLLWLPPVYSDDGRCLWAWVDWERACITMGRQGMRLEILTEDGFVDQRFDTPVTLPEALLRAIREQDFNG